MPVILTFPAQAQHPPTNSSPGFTLPELLTATTIGLLLTVAGVAIWRQNLLATTTLTTAQELRDRWSRVALFINADIAESCDAAVENGTDLVLTVDRTPDTPCADPGNLTITYSLNDDILQRTGPPINEDGTLNLTATSATEPLVDGVTFFNPDCTTALQACYRLTLRQGTSTYSGTGEASIEGRVRVREY